MKKVIILGLVVLMVAILSSCNNDTEDLTDEELLAYNQYESSNQDGSQFIPAPTDITMNTLSYTSSGLTFYFENATDNVYTYSEDFALYTFVNSVWKPVEVTIDGYWGFADIAYDIFPNSITEERVVDWVWLFGELPSGDYRFQKSLLYVRQPGDFDKFVLESDFTLP